MSDWIKISACCDPIPDDWSLLADAFDAHGCPGSIVEGSALAGYLATSPGSEAVVERLRQALLQRGACRVDVEILPEENWAELWKQHFKPRKVGRVVLCPTWETYDVMPDEVLVLLDPGQAFGTGDHPTTRLCLRLMQTVGLSDKTFADIGCGSGVLAIAAALLGANVELASDLDALSVDITNENMARNGVHFPTAIAPGFDAAPGRQFDFVVSNIISATLIRLAPDAFRAVAPMGSWVVSGIIESNWSDVQRAAESAGFLLRAREVEDEWVGGWFQRPVER